jgi:hypothetical protein
MSKRTQLDRNIDAMRRLRGTLFGEVRQIVRKQGTFRDYLAAKERTFSGPKWDKLSGAMQCELRGYASALHDMLQCVLCEWRLSYQGRLVRSEEVPAGKWCDVDADAGHFCWKGTEEVYS